MSNIAISIIILVIGMILFFTELFPIPFVSMGILIAYILTGVLEPAEAFAGFTDSSVLLFMAMFIIGEALFVTGVADEIGMMVSKRAKTETQTIVLIMVIAGVLSAFLSNTGTAAVFIPIVLSISKTSGIPRSRLLMPLVLAVTLGGSLTLLGTPPNLIVSGQLNQIGDHFGVFEFVPVVLPMFIVSIVYYVLIGRKFFSVEKEQHAFENDDMAIGEAGDVSGKDIPDWKRYIAVGVLILAIIGMVLSDFIGMPFHVIAWACALILIFTRTINQAEALRAIDMQTILLIVGTLSIGTALEKTGAGSVIAQTVLGFVGTNPRAILAAILIITTVLSNFMSNTATAALFAPIGISIALEIGADPRAVLMAVAIGAGTSYATPIGSPPNTMVYGIGGFKFSDYAKVGLPLIVINFIVAMILLPIFFPFYP